MTAWVSVEGRGVEESLEEREAQRCPSFNAKIFALSQPWQFLHEIIFLR